MTVQDKNILWLDLFEFLTYSKKIKLLESVEKGIDIRQCFLSNAKIKDILTNEEFNKMALCLQEEFLLLKLKAYEKDNIICITFYDENYPYMLKEISSPPLCLYCKGNTQLLNSICVIFV